MFPLDFGEFRVTRAKCVRHQPWKTARNSEFRKKLGNTKKKKNSVLFRNFLVGIHFYTLITHISWLTHSSWLSMLRKCPKTGALERSRTSEFLKKHCKKIPIFFFLVCKCLKNIHTHCCLLIFIQFNFFPCLFLFFRSLTIPEWSKPTLNVLPLSNTHPQMFSYHVLLFFYLFIYFSVTFYSLIPCFCAFSHLFSPFGPLELEIVPINSCLDAQSMP